MTISYLDSVVRLPLLPLPVRTPVVHLAGADILISPGSQLTQAQLTSAGGMAKVREVLFLHKASRTLIVTDLCFNLLDARGLGARFILGLFGTYARFGVSRLYLRFVTDRARFEESLRKLFAWEFDHIAVSHGRLVEGSGRARLLAALQERGLCRDVA